VIDVEEGIVGRGPEDPCWDKPWLEELLDLPSNATWPRFMTTVHPSAVDSYGAECVAWLITEGGIRPRWWQHLAIVRQLEHDADGNLVWLEELLSTSRQSGKSTKLRGAALWRLHASTLFGEEQTILHTAKDLAVSREVRRSAQAWAQAHGYDTREANGQESITEPLSGSRWLVRGKNSIYGYSTSLGVVDECWGIDAEIVDDGMLPTALERNSPQMILASTAHRRATSMFPQRRAAALQELDSPGSTLLIEWSAPRTCDIEDRAAWRMASPHWSAGRERLLEARLRKVQSGQTLDPDEDDPTESFRCQFLNSWLPQTVTDPGEPVLDMAVWMKARGAVSPTRVFAAIEDYFGKGSAVAVVAREGERYEIDAWTVPSWDQAVADVAQVFHGREHGRLLLGPSMWDKIGGSMLSARCVTSSDTKSGLSLLRQLIKANKVVHDNTPELDQQMQAVRVRELASGMNLVPGTRNDLIKASVWALQAAHRQRLPGIH